MFIITLTCFLAITKVNSGSILSNLQGTIPEDALLNFTQLASKYGRQSEEFDVETDDGYILKLFHITGNEAEQPVLLMHGILDSADTFVLRGNTSIVINLAEAGHDIWVGNARGNKYSRRNVKLSPDENKKDFWDFSFHEMGIYDLPAIIDFILKKTGKSKLATIGYSQGTTIFYALGSVRPEYNKKISVFISLAPIAYLSDTSSAVTVLTTNFPLINAILESVGIDELLRDKSATNQLIQLLCTKGLLSYDLCEKGIVSAIAGDDSEELEKEFFDILVYHFPAGTSRKAFTHFAQIANSAHFAQFDFGATKNMLVYNTASSPLYNLTQATMPIALVAAANDGLSGLKDVERLKSELPNVVFYHVMERKEFNHVDYVWGKHGYVYVTPLLRKLLRKFA